MLGTRYLGRGRVGLVANKTVVLDTEAGTEGGFFAPQIVRCGLVPEKTLETRRELLFPDLEFYSAQMTHAHSCLFLPWNGNPRHCRKTDQAFALSIILCAPVLYMAAQLF